MPFLWAGVGVTAFLIGAFFLGIFPRYETNDDATMNLIVSGKVLSDTPDEHLYSSNILIGLALRRLYVVAPEIPWYGIFLVLVLWAALVGLVYAFLRANGSRKQVMLSCCFVVAVGLPCLVNLQFTRVAFLAALAGLVLLSVAAGRTPDIRAWVGGFSLLAVAALVRFDACLFAGLVFSPAIAWAWWRPANPGSSRRLGLCLVGFLALGFGLESYNRWYYDHSPGWEGFYDFNTLRAEFTDYGRVEYTEHLRPVFESVGWSKSDLLMLREWGFVDRQLFSAEKMRIVLASALPQDRVKARHSGDMLAETVSQTKLGPILITGAACLLLMGGGLWSRLVPCLCFLATVTLCLALHFRFHLQPRLLFPALCVFVAAAVAGSVGSFAPSLGRTWSWVAARHWAAWTFVVALLLWQVGYYVFLSDLNRLRRARAEAMLADLAPQPGQLIILWGAHFPYEDLVLPLDDQRALKGLKACSLGAYLQTPLTARRLQSFGIDDLFKALYERPDVFLVSTQDQNQALGAYLSRHYGVRLGARVVLRHHLLKGAQVLQLADLRTLSPPGTPEGQR
jgi:hypothetical protein